MILEDWSWKVLRKTNVQINPGYCTYRQIRFIVFRIHRKRNFVLMVTTLRKLALYYVLSITSILPGGFKSLSEISKSPQLAFKYSLRRDNPYQPIRHKPKPTIGRHEWNGWSYREPWHIGTLNRGWPGSSSVVVECSPCPHAMPSEGFLSSCSNSAVLISIQVFSTSGANGVDQGLLLLKARLQFRPKRSLRHETIDKSRHCIRPVRALTIKGGTRGNEDMRPTTRIWYLQSPRKLAGVSGESYQWWTVVNAVGDKINNLGNIPLIDKCNYEEAVTGALAHFLFALQTSSLGKVHVGDAAVVKYCS